MPNQEVMKQTLELLETMEEGFTYIKKKLGELNTEGTITVLTDLINAFTEIDKSIFPSLEELSESQVPQKSNKLTKAFDTMVKEYESNRGQKAYEITQLTLEPAFKHWKEELEKVLKPYIVS